MTVSNSSSDVVSPSKHRTRERVVYCTWLSVCSVLLDPTTIDELQCKRNICYHLIQVDEVRTILL